MAAVPATTDGFAPFRAGPLEVRPDELQVLADGRRAGLTVRGASALRRSAAAPVHRSRPGRGGPEVLLLDEPCSALDPRSTAIIEDLIVALREELAVVIVTHNLQQAYRIADYVAFMYLGELVEYGEAEQVFGEPRAERTRDYVSGAFG